VQRHRQRDPVAPRRLEDDQRLGRRDARRAEALLERRMARRRVLAEKTIRGRYAARL